MPMPSYPVICYASGCSREALYKVAARWSDGITAELKTYYLACAQCLPGLFREAKRKRDLCRLAVGETLEAPGIYWLDRTARDQQLQRLGDLESKCDGTNGSPERPGGGN